MELCSSGHEQICFEGRSNDCPLCELIKECEDLQAIIDSEKREEDR